MSEYGANFGNVVFGKGEIESDSDSDSEDISSDENLGGRNYGYGNNDLEDDDDDDDDGGYTPSLGEVIEEAKDIGEQITQLEIIVASNPTIQTVHDVKDQVASIFGVLEDLQYEIDSLLIVDASQKILRRRVIQEVEGMFTQIADLSDKCLEVLRVKADEERIKGNTSFKKQEFETAIRHYSMAIAIEPQNATLYTNRALAYQKVIQYDRCIGDAKTAVRIDANYLKAYIILIKCQLAADMLVSASETIGDIPIAFHERVEVMELAQAVAAAAKDSGNVSFKAGDLNEAISMYTVAITCNPDEHVYYSNRSAAYQSRKSWREALSDAERCLKRCSTFAKGYVHMGRCQIQLKRYEDAERTVSLANTILEGTPELTTISQQLADISQQVHYTKQQAATREATGPSPTIKAEQFKDMGNKYYKSEEYQEAIRYYTQALSLLPKEGAYYGNRAAAWLMMKEYKRAVKDCKDGLEHEQRVGSLDKLRIRHATALSAMGQVQNAITVLEDSLEINNRENFDSITSMKNMIEKLNDAKQYKELGVEALENKAFTRSRRLFENAQKGGLTDDPKVLLGLSQAALGLHEYEEASRTAQKVIEADSGMIEAYVLRADALLAMGCTDLAEKHLKVALQRDPDNGVVQRKLKKVRRIVSELVRVRSLIDTAMNDRKFEEALVASNDGLNIDRDSKKIMSEMHGRRSKAYSMIAQQHQRSPNTNNNNGEDGSLSPAQASWKKSLQEANSSLYYDASSANIPTLFLKCAALQALERWEEAHSELETCYKGIGEDDSTVAAKYKEAKMLLKKSKRPDLYKVLGVTQGEHATEAEIKKAYKKSALKWHPDRHSSKGEAQKKEAESKFKEIGDAVEVLTDPQRKSLYDQGYDREEIEQKMEEQKQRQEYAGHGGRRGGGGFYGF
jgi:DnaJ homolog subfamily C member 7